MFTEERIILNQTRQELFHSVGVIDHKLCTIIDESCGLNMGIFDQFAILDIMKDRFTISIATHFNDIRNMQCI